MRRDSITANWCGGEGAWRAFTARSCSSATPRSLRLDQPRKWTQQRCRTKEQQALIWPVVRCGHYPAFIDYPASTSVSAEIFNLLVRDILVSIERAGAAQTVIINTGISTIAPLRNVLAAWSGGLAPALINCYEGPRFSAATQALPEQAFGGRAHEIETSLMLAIDAARVRLGRAAASNSEIVSGRLNRANPSAAISSPRGVNGDPTLASQIKGEQLLAALLADLIAAVRASASGAEHALYYNRRASFELPHARRTLSGFTRAALPPPAMEAC